MIGRSFISLIPRSLKIASGRKFFCSLPGDREILHFDDPLQARDHLIQDDNANRETKWGNEAGRFVQTFRSGKDLHQNAPPHSPQSPKFTVSSRSRLSVRGISFSSTCLLLRLNIVIGNLMQRERDLLQQIDLLYKIHNVTGTFSGRISLFW